MTPEILTAVIVAVLSSKLWDFLAARFKRKDEVEDKEDYAQETGGGAFVNIPQKTTNNYTQISNFVDARLTYVDSQINAL